MESRKTLDIIQNIQNIRCNGVQNIKTDNGFIVCLKSDGITKISQCDLFIYIGQAFIVDLFKCFIKVRASAVQIAEIRACKFSLQRSLKAF